jgi:hypothetical protein
VSEDEGYFKATVKTFQFKVEQGTQLDALTSASLTCLSNTPRSARTSTTTPSSRPSAATIPASSPIRWRESATRYRREAGTARNLRSHRPADPCRRDAGYRDRKLSVDRTIRAA